MLEQNEPHRVFYDKVKKEFGYYDSLDDRGGEDPGIENSQSKFLLGYQKAFPQDFTLGLQYYSELMHKYSDFYSPDEKDLLMIPEMSYNFTDNLKAVVGANIFSGANDNSALGQHNKNDNIYTTMRYSF